MYWVLSVLLHYTNCTAHYTLNITLCTLDFVHCTMHIALWTLHYEHCTMNIALCTLHCAHCTVRISLCTFHCAQFTVQIALCAQLCKVAKMQRCLKTEVGYTRTHRQTSKGTGWLLELLSQLKMPQRRDIAGAVCDSGIGMLFLNRQFLSYRRLLHQKMG